MSKSQYKQTNENASLLEEADQTKPPIDRNEDELPDVVLEGVAGGYALNGHVGNK